MKIVWARNIPDFTAYIRLLHSVNPPSMIRVGI